MLGIALLSALDFISHKEFLQKDYYFNSYAFRQQLEIRINENYKNLQKSFSIKNRDLRYYIQDKNTKEVYTNLGFEPNEQYIREQALYTLTFPHEPYPESDFQVINEYFQRHNLKGIIMIPKKTGEYSQIHADYTYYRF